jgi:hypothetical protein
MLVLLLTAKLGLLGGQQVLLFMGFPRSLLGKGEQIGTKHDKKTKEKKKINYMLNIYKKKRGSPQEFSVP